MYLGSVQVSTGVSIEVLIWFSILVSSGIYLGLEFGFLSGSILVLTGFYLVVY